MWFLGLELLLQVLLLPIPVVTQILQSLLIEWRVLMEQDDRSFEILNKQTKQHKLK